MKKAALLFLLSGSLVFKSQVTLLSENFNSGLPLWIQNPAGSWTLHPSFGFSASPCIITEEAGSTSAGTTTIKMSAINLSGVINPTVSFKAAITKNNFLAGNMVIYYDQGSGPQFVARWGSGFSPNTTDTIPEDGFDPVPPLDSNNIYWHSYSHTISAIGNTVSIILGAELFNGGYILFDDIKVAATPVNPTGVADSELENAVSIFPNPVSDGQIMFKAEKIKSVSISNQLGETLKMDFEKLNEERFMFNTSLLSPGIYYLNILTKNDVVIPKKVVVE